MQLRVVGEDSRRSVLYRRGRRRTWDAWSEITQSDSTSIHAAGEHAHIIDTGDRKVQRLGLCLWVVFLESMKTKFFAGSEMGLKCEHCWLEGDKLHDPILHFLRELRE